jgi:beta-N-acetylhexosaminidase
MRSVSTLFERPDAAVQFMAAGNDVLMICVHWTDTERARALADSMRDAQRSGAIDRRILDRARDRIDAMLAATPTMRWVHCPTTYFAVTRCQACCLRIRRRT